MSLKNRLSRLFGSTPKSSHPRVTSCRPLCKHLASRRLLCEPLEDRRMLSITLFVDGDVAPGGDGQAWGTAYNDLQAALAQAALVNADGDTTNDVTQIWIAEGTYLPSAELEPGDARSAAFSLLDNVTLYGGFAGTETALEERDFTTHTTTLSGDLGVALDTTDNAYTVVYCGQAITATLDGLLINNGRANGASSPVHPERSRGGGIYTEGILTIVNSKLLGNSAYNGDGGGVCNAAGTCTVVDSVFSFNFACEGGGIYSHDGSVIVSGSTLSDNQAEMGGGIYNDGYGGTADFNVIDSILSDNSTFYGDGGGIYNNGNTGTANLILQNATLSRNLACGNGGGIYNDNATLTINHTTLSDNSANKNGGGIHNDNSVLAVTDSSFLENTAGSDNQDAGGGIYNYSNEGTAVLTVERSVFFHNMAPNGSGIFNGSYLGTTSVDVINSRFMLNFADVNGGGISACTDDGTIEGTVNMTVTNSTFYNNSASNGGGIFCYGIATYSTIQNTVVAQNMASSSGPDIYSDAGWLMTGSYNLIGDGSGQTAFLNNSNNNMVGTSTMPIDPMLDPADGSPMMWSPVIDAGSNDLVPDGVITDLADNYRIHNGTVDIGAYEFDSVPLIPGDANADQQVDGSDATLLAANWQAGVGDGQTATWSMGDFNHDGQVDGSDATLLASHWQESVAGSGLSTSAASGIVTLSIPETLLVDADVPAGGDGASWATAYTDLQDALDQAATLNTDGDTENDITQIWIAEGTYLPSAELEPGDARSAAFSLLDGVTLYGGFAGTETAIEERDFTTHITTLSGDLGVTDDTTDNAYTVVYCDGTITATLDGLSITDGNANGVSDDNHPERHCGGGVYSEGSLTVANAMVVNHAGCGIYNKGELTVTDSTFSGNTGSCGSGIYNGGELTVTDSTFSGNRSAVGGALGNNSGTLTVTDSTFLNNSASARGGAIFNSGGTLVIDNSTFCGNSVEDGHGGGIGSWEGIVTIANSTFSNNHASEYGGGLYGAHQMEPDKCTVTNSTFWGNDAETGGGIYMDNSYAAINNTVVAGNTAGLSAPDRYGPMSGGYNLIGDGSGSGGLVDGVDGNQVGTAASPIDPMLGPLQDNGGPTLTHEPLAGSPVIDAGSDSLAVDPDGEPLLLEQRGYARLHGTVDIGAVEYQPMGVPVAYGDGFELAQDGALLFAATDLLGNDFCNTEDPLDVQILTDPEHGTLVDHLDGTFTYTPASGFWGTDIISYRAVNGSLVSNTAEVVFSVLSPDSIVVTIAEDEQDGDLSPDDISLREAIYDLGASQIQFSIGLFDQDVLVNNTFEPGGVHVVGLGANHLVLNGTQFTSGRVFRMLEQNSIISDLKIVGGNRGAIYNAADLAIENVIFSGNSSTIGGALGNSGTLTITDSTFSNNSAFRGGGAINNIGTMTIMDSMFLDNSTSQVGIEYGGGAIRNDTGTLTVISSVFSGNSAYESDCTGGGIFNLEGTLIVDGSTFSENDAYFGGGVGDFRGDVTITNSTFSDNYAIRGGGFYELASVSATITNSTFFGNHAEDNGGGISVGSNTVINNTIVANNTAGNSGPDLYGTLTGSHNLIGNGSGQTGLVDGVDGNQVGTSAVPLDPMLGPLQDNGGPTLTMEPLAGSPVLDAGNDDLATNMEGFPLWTDQRGYARRYGTVDIGAVESQPSGIPVACSDGFELAQDGSLLFNASDLLGNDFCSDGSPLDVQILTSPEHGTLVDNQDGTFTYTPASGFWGTDIISYQAVNGSPVSSVTEVVFSVISPDSVIVTIVEDEQDGDLSAGDISLREALEDLSATQVQFSIDLFEREILVNSTFSLNNVHLVGLGQLHLAIDAQDQCRIFTIATGSSTLSDLAARDGYDSSGSVIANDADLAIVNMTIFGNNNTAVFNGGIMTVSGTAIVNSTGRGIYNLGTLAVSDSAFLDNASSGILNEDTLSVSDSTFSNNAHSGICNMSGSATVVDSTFSNNSAPTYGGAIFNTDGTLLVDNSTFCENSAEVGGGGIFSNSSDVAITNSTFLNNYAGRYGGGFFGFHDFSSESTITNSTFFGNHAEEKGGGIYSTGSVSAIQMNNTIVAGNTIGYAGSDIFGTVIGAHNLIGDGKGQSELVDGVNGNQVGTSGSPVDPMLGPLQDNGGSTPTMEPLPGSPALDAGGDCLATDPNGFPLWTDQRGYARRYGTVDIGAVESQPPGIPVARDDGFDLPQDGSLLFTVSDLLGNDSCSDGSSLSAQVLTDPEHGTLVDHQDGTFTYTPESGYWGADTISYQAVNGSAVSNPADVIFATISPQSTIVTVANDEQNGDLSVGDVSLREAIYDLNASQIQFSPNLWNQVIFVDDVLEIAYDTHIVGLGTALVLSAAKSQYPRIFNVQQQHVTISDLKIVDCLDGAIYNTADLTIENTVFSDNYSSCGSAIRNEGTLTITGSTFSHNGGGAIYNTADLTIENTVFSDNYSPCGSAIRNEGTLTATGSTFSHNVAYNTGGAIYNQGALMIAGSIFDINYTETDTSDSGGAIYSSGALTVSDSTFSNNSTYGSGGAIHCDEGALYIDSSTFSNNSAGYHGGAIRNYKGPLTVTNSTFAENSAGRDGGGIQSGGSDTTAITNSIFLNNFAGELGGGLHGYFAEFIVVNSTFLGNHANSARGGISFLSCPANTIYNTIVAGNGLDLYGPVTGSHNLIGDGSGQSGLVNGVNGNQVGTSAAPIDPMLDANGYPLAGSPVIDAGGNALVPVGVTTDKAGNYRIHNGTVDIGAYEFDSIPLIPGDANTDQQVDGSDATLLAANWQVGVSDGQTATWSMGDFNHDGQVDGSDATLLASHWQETVPQAVAASDSAWEVAQNSEAVRVATVPTQESLLPRQFITPISRSVDAVFGENTWSALDRAAVAKELATVSAKKSAAACDAFFALKLDLYADPE